MQSINGLMQSLNQHFGWNKARINCFVPMLLGLIAVRTVNLPEMAIVFDSDVKVSSRYRRLQRFFACPLPKEAPYDSAFLSCREYIPRAAFPNTRNDYSILGLWK